MKLFEPGKIGTLSLKNRIVMAAMGNMLAELDGRFSERAIDYYVARAKGGAGLIITDAIRTRHIEQIPIAPFVDRTMADSKIYAGRLAELVESVHDYGAKLAVQVTPGMGRNAKLEVIKNVGAIAPSPQPAFWDRSIMARELKIEEIERLVKSLQVIAEVARTAGVDAIEINSHAGYLSDEFLTSLWNKRTDQYGGKLENRMRFLLEIVAAIRKGAGANFPVMVKYGLTHYIEGGRQIEEGLEIARRLEAAGVNALEIDGGCYEVLYWTMPPTTQPPGTLVHLAEKVKQAVKIPVITVGKLGYPQLAEKVLQEGKADFIALGRALLADPDWANKVKQGKLDDICPCIGDFEGCLRRGGMGMSIRCTVNATTGMEKQLELKPAETKKSVLVVGGGPGGMEAARVAALRGHRVTLWEKTARLGGSLVPASVPDFKKDYGRLIEYQSTQLKKRGVTVELGKEATPALIRKMKPDVVLIATGATPLIPDIPGIKNEKVICAVEALSKKTAGKRIAMIGGGLVGSEVALYLAQNGKDVTIVEMLNDIACDMHHSNRLHLLKLLSDANVRVLTSTTVVEVTDEGLVISDKNGQKSTLKADCIVLACGLKSDQRLAEALGDGVPEVRAIGDCVEPRKLMNAIWEGFRIARLI